MRVPLSPIVVLSLLAPGCCSPWEREAHFVYGSNLDTHGPMLLLWPVDERGAVFRRTTQPGEGLHLRAKGHTFTTPHAGDWQMAGDVTLEGVVVILPPRPGDDLRERASELAAGLGRVYPEASLHVVRTRLEPYGIESVAELEARLKDACYEHLGSRPEYSLGNTYANALAMNLVEVGVAEFGIIPLAGDEVRYAVATPSREGESAGLLVQEVDGEGIVAAIRELATETRCAREWRLSSEESGTPARLTIRSGRIRAVLPRGAPEEVRRTLESALRELQKTPLAAAPTGQLEPDIAPEEDSWLVQVGIELRFATSMEWGDYETVEDVCSGGILWLLLYLSP